MAAVLPRHPLAYVMHREGWSHRQLASLLQADAADAQTAMGAAHGKIWKWMHGTTPDRLSQLLLARRLGVDPTMITRHPWPRWLPAYDGMRTDIADDHDGALNAFTELDADLPDRRAFLLLSGAPLVDFAGRRVPETSTLTGRHGSRVDAELLDDIEAGPHRLRRMEAKLGGRQVLQMIHGELRTVIGLLREAGYSTGEGRRLHRVAAELARLGGWAAFDNSWDAAAQRYWTTGLYAARAAGDRLIVANITKSLSLQCLDHGRVDDALAVADAALGGLKSLSRRVETMFTLRRARALAMRGDRTACVRLIAGTDVDDAAISTIGEDPDWIGYFDSSEYCAQVGTCYLDLRDPETADRWFAQALSLIPPTKIRDKATYLLRRADVSARQGNLLKAETLARDAKALMRTASSARNDGRLGDLRARLRRLGPRGRDLATRLAHA